MDASHSQHGTAQHHYKALLFMAVLSFIAMYALMYAMVNVAGNIYNSVNQVYMAGLMTAPMVVIELFVMRSMYQDGRLNAFIASFAVVGGLACFVLIRQQTGVTDRQFLRSMIPHHAGAILMCGEAPIRDADIQRLCKTIISGQQAEIEQMKAKLRDLGD